MNNSTSNFNPARLIDQIDESFYPVPGWSEKGTELNREREARVDSLRKKYKDDAPSLALADKLEGCKPKARCKSPACPECAYAATRLLTPVIKKYLDDQTEAGNTIVCVSVVPADGMTKPGQLSAAQHQRNVRGKKPSAELTRPGSSAPPIGRSTSTRTTGTPGTSRIISTGSPRPRIRTT